MEAWWCSLFKMWKIVLYYRSTDSIYLALMYARPITRYKHCQKPFLYSGCSCLNLYMFVMCMTALFRHFSSKYSWKKPKALRGPCPRSCSSPGPACPVSADGGSLSPPAVPEELLGQSLCIFAACTSEVLLQPELRFASSAEHLLYLCAQLAVGT